MQLAQQNKRAVTAKTTSTSSATQDKPVAKPGQDTPAKPVKTGLLAGWLGDTDNNSDEYIDDLFKAADNALVSENYASAKQNYREILQIAPNNQRAQQGLSNVEQRVSENLARSNEAYTSDLLNAAENALQTDRLSSASYNYQEVLRLSPENTYAQQGLNKVFNRYLALAVEEARDDDFDDAAEYYLAASKLRPDDEELKTVGQQIAQLQNQ